MGCQWIRSEMADRCASADRGMMLRVSAHLLTGVIHVRAERPEAPVEMIWWIGGVAAACCRPQGTVATVGNSVLKHGMLLCFSLVVSLHTNTSTA